MHSTHRHVRTTVCRDPSDDSFLNFRILRQVCATIVSNLLRNPSFDALVFAKNATSHPTVSEGDRVALLDFFYTKPKHALNSQCKNHPAGCQAFTKINFCRPETTILKDNGHLSHATFDALTPIQHFFLKCISFRHCQRPVDLCEFAHAITSKTAAVVMRPQTKTQSRPHINRLTHQFSPARPPCHATAANIAGANHHIAL